MDFLTNELVFLDSSPVSLSLEFFFQILGSKCNIWGFMDISVHKVFLLWELDRGVLLVLTHRFVPFALLNYI